MAFSTNDLKNGMSLNLPEGLFSVVEFQHVKPGKGGAFVRTKLKNLRSGAVIERTYRADEKLDQAIIDKRDMQFLYRDGSDYVFMDTSTYEQMQAAPDTLGTAPDYLKEGDEANLQMYNGEIVGVDLPASVELNGDRDRARGAGRPGVGRPQAGHLQTGPGGPGPAVRQPRRRHQGRHPHRRVSDAGLSRATVPARAKWGRAPRSRTARAPRHQQRERALSLLYEAELKGESPLTCWTGCRCGPIAYVCTLLERGRGHPGRGRRAHHRRLGRLAARPHGGHRPPRAAPGRGRAPRRRRAAAGRGHRRGGRAGQDLLHRRLGLLRQRDPLDHRGRGAAGLRLTQCPGRRGAAPSAIRYRL